MNKYQEALNKILYAFEHAKLTELENFDLLQELINKQTYQLKWHLISENDLPINPLRVLIQMSNGWQHVAFYEDGKWEIVGADENLEENDYYKVIAWLELPEYEWQDSIGDKKIKYSHGYSMYKCKYCGEWFPIELEEGIDDFSEENKPSPIVIRCPYCKKGSASSTSGIIKYSTRQQIKNGLMYFANIEGKSCGALKIMESDEDVK